MKRKRGTEEDKPKKKRKCSVTVASIVKIMYIRDLRRLLKRVAENPNRRLIQNGQEVTFTEFVHGLHCSVTKLRRIGLTMLKPSDFGDMSLADVHRLFQMKLEYKKMNRIKAEDNKNKTLNNVQKYMQTLMGTHRTL